MMNGLDTEHLRTIREILKKHVPGHTVWAFGSRVSGKCGRYSDLDIVILSQEPLNLVLLGNIRDDFGESDLPFRVDVVDWATTSDEFKEILKREHEVLQAGKQ